MYHKWIEPSIHLTLQFVWKTIVYSWKPTFFSVYFRRLCVKFLKIIREFIVMNVSLWSLPPSLPFLNNFSIPWKWSIAWIFQASFFYKRRFFQFFCETICLYAVSSRFRILHPHPHCSETMHCMQFFLSYSGTRWINHSTNDLAYWATFLVVFCRLSKTHRKNRREKERDRLMIHIRFHVRRVWVVFGLSSNQ